MLLKIVIKSRTLFEGLWALCYCQTSPDSVSQKEPTEGLYQIYFVPITTTYIACFGWLPQQQQQQPYQLCYWKLELNMQTIPNLHNEIHNSTNSAICSNFSELQQDKKEKRRRRKRERADQDGNAYMLVSQRNCKLRIREKSTSANTYRGSPDNTNFVLPWNRTIEKLY